MNLYSCATVFNLLDLEVVITFSAESNEKEARRVANIPDHLKIFETGLLSLNISSEIGLDISISEHGVKISPPIAIQSISYHRLKESEKDNFVIKDADFEKIDMEEFLKVLKAKSFKIDGNRKYWQFCSISTIVNKID